MLKARQAMGSMPGYEIQKYCQGTGKAHDQVLKSLLAGWWEMPCLQSAWTSTLSRVSWWPLPGTRHLKPAWLRGVGPDPPTAGEGGVIWDTNLALLGPVLAAGSPG